MLHRAAIKKATCRREISNLNLKWPTPDVINPHLKAVNIKDRTKPRNSEATDTG